MKWIINFTILIGFFGMIFGLVLGGLNPWTNPSEAARMDLEIAHQAVEYQRLDRVSDAKADAEVQAIQREQNLLNAQNENAIQALNQDLEHRDLAFKTWMTVLTYAGGALFFALSIVIIIAAVAWIFKAPANARSTQVRENSTELSSASAAPAFHSASERKTSSNLLEHLYETRLGERLQELSAQREFNEMIARKNTVLRPDQMSRKEYNNLPLAGD